MNLQNSISRIIGPEIVCLPLFSAPRYRHRLYDNYYFTDLVRKKLCERGAFWLIERIFALQENLRGRAFGKTQLWDLKTMPDGYVTITCSDRKTGEVLFYDHGYPDRPLRDDLAFILQRNILHIRNA